MQSTQEVAAADVGGVREIAGEGDRVGGGEPAVADLANSEEAGDGVPPAHPATSAASVIETAITQRRDTADVPPRPGILAASDDCARPSADDGTDRRDHQASDVSAAGERTRDRQE